MDVSKVINFIIVYQRRFHRIYQESVVVDGMGGFSSFSETFPYAMHLVGITPPHTHTHINHKRNLFNQTKRTEIIKLPSRFLNALRPTWRSCMVTSLTGPAPNPLVHYYFDLYVISSGSIQKNVWRKFPDYEIDCLGQGAFLHRTEISFLSLWKRKISKRPLRKYSHNKIWRRYRRF